ncbi:hypothetical protein SteCoe_8098 [Stentor coeruleus]|uniref:Uncharacterized protein n=1 Tax=Stentor coeruleus TaxID=5963 RepID=A0A1R2CL32_9CILI|nr:hypothetical protein SteCoe_8098 [Stentor coeruleus]
MWSVNEPMTARRQTRLKFLEQESEQLRTYKSDLEFCLLNTKRLLSEMLSAQVIISHRRTDSSIDTEVASHVPIKNLENALEKNFSLLNTLKKAKRERDMILGRVLISEQLSEEALRKEQELIQESDEQISDVKYVLDKKEARISNLKTKIEAMEAEISKLKNESVIILPLSEDHLYMFKQIEKIKFSLSKVSKKLQIAEMQSEELAEHYKTLSAHLNQYRVLLKNPMIRSKKAANLASTQALDMSVYINIENSDSSSSEICFPDKLQIETKSKPNLPKLDFTKVVRNSVSEKKIQNDLHSQIKSKSEYLERKCKEKTELLNNLRTQIKMQMQKNAKLVIMVNGKKYSDKSPERMKSFKKKRKRAMSNTLEYLTHEENYVNKARATEESEKKEVKSSEEDSLGNISSFNGSEVAKLEYQEADSILAEYIHEINHR